LLRELSTAMAGYFGKPEQWVMTSIVPAAMTFAGTEEPCCFVAIKNIGKMTPAQTSAISADLCPRLARALALPQNRIYIDFADATDYLWGYDAATFRD
jgi:hypothetical protein